MTEIPHEWVQSGAEAIEFETGFAGEDPHRVALTVIEAVLPDIRQAIAEDLRAEARRMHEAYRRQGPGSDPYPPRRRPVLDDWANAYEAAAERIVAIRYPWQRGSS